ncbi:S8 family peptidase [Mesonia sp. HuA40]|uniref:S8 family peptidase n=1 Tax=Mesonia sp. HuA40 TaxID=2602761 RepID=UPI0011C7A345|nr:S8 family peptidase [Mesonia sp. HuA40]TXK72623.1 S8 family serine peptidase [Mesonia sp. HuA40]
MRKPFLKSAFAAATVALIAASCGTTSPVITSTPIQNIDQQPLKNIALTDVELKGWGGADLVQDTIPGMSVQKAYDEIIKDYQGKTVIVGVIDSGVDIEHEDLKNVIWVNEDEIPGNGIDDDKNGYIDDIHGWNFLGDAIAENLEYVRIIKRLQPKYEGKTKNDVAASDLAEFEMYQAAQQEFEKEYNETTQNQNYYQQLLASVNNSSKLVSEKLGKEDFSRKELMAMEADTPELQQAQAFLNNIMMNIGDLEEAKEQLQEGIDYFNTRLESHFNLELDGRAIVGDDPYDITDVNYGNNDVDGPDEKKEDAKHGTHVAGIIAAERNNNIGMNGVAKNVKIMALRAVPDGDEYDKDIALAIRYAVDNGAKVINTSFGKYFSQDPEWVTDAIKYAAKHDVLIVNAAGNDATDLDTKMVYPNDQKPGESQEISNNFLTVGASNYAYGDKLVASFSNYGKQNVDVFAPGTKIWATTPLDQYEYLQGTSMAAPAVAGVAALIRSYYPKLTAAQVKQVIMQSGLSSSADVIVGGNPEDVRPFSELSVSGKMVNLYNAFILADKMSK